MGLRIAKESIHPLGRQQIRYCAGESDQSCGVSQQQWIALIVNNGFLAQGGVLPLRRGVEEEIETEFQFGLLVEFPLCDPSSRPVAIESAIEVLIPFCPKMHPLDETCK